MQYNKLGRTGLKISNICLGTNMFGASYVTDIEAELVIKESYEQGINFIDTADFYNEGRSEKIIGNAIKTQRNNFVIATKGFMPTNEDINSKGLSRKHIITAVEKSLKRLSTDYIDLYQLHYWDPECPIDETINTLNNMVHQGKIRYLGCSNFAAWQLCKSLWVSDKNNYERFESVQPEYNFLQKDIEKELMPLCIDQNISIIPYQILMGGLLTGKYSKNSKPTDNSHLASVHAQRAKNKYWNDNSFNMINKLKSIQKKTGYNSIELTIAWALSRPAVSSVIVGASKKTQILSNSKATGITLDKQILDQLNSL